ncbi:C-type mannose receptor 2 [Mactra antiquata]
MWFLYLIGFVFLAGVEGQVSCTRGFQEYLDACYHLSTEKETWAGAEEICRMHGAYLIEINSVDEHYLVSNMSVKNDEYIWIGLQDLLIDGEYEWSHSTSLLNGPGYWGQGEPDQTHGKNCVYYYTEFGEGRWSDTYCTNTRYYICEKDPETIVIG